MGGGGREWMSRTNFGRNPVAPSKMCNECFMMRSGSLVDEKRWGKDVAPSKIMNGHCLIFRPRGAAAEEADRVARARIRDPEKSGTALTRGWSRNRRAGSGQTGCWEEALTCGRAARAVEWGDWGQLSMELEERRGFAKGSCGSASMAARVRKEGDSG